MLVELQVCTVGSSVVGCDRVIFTGVCTLGSKGVG